MDFINEQNAFPKIKKKRVVMFVLRIFSYPLSAVFLFYFYNSQSRKVGKKWTDDVLGIGQFSLEDYSFVYIHKKRSGCVARLLLQLTYLFYFLLILVSGILEKELHQK